LGTSTSKIESRFVISIQGSPQFLYATERNGPPFLSSTSQEARSVHQSLCDYAQLLAAIDYSRLQKNKMNTMKRNAVRRLACSCLAFSASSMASKPTGPALIVQCLFRLSIANEEESTIVEFQRASPQGLEEQSGRMSDKKEWRIALVKGKTGKVPLPREAEHKEQAKSRTNQHPQCAV
jgi:hypothetical protein